jgi:polo-like kinase 1
VYFNDSTKAVLVPKGDDFVYVERKKVGDAKMEQVPENYTLTVYPDSLQKKVTLLKHFRNYLIEQHKRDENNEENALNDLASGGNEDAPTVFLKKWVRTKHAILFRLSNQTVQVVFYDHTEILLSSEARIVTYVNKRRGRETYHLEDIVNTAEHNDIKKRLKYAEGILQQLISTPKK